MRPSAPVSRIFPGTLLLVAACGGDPVVQEPNTITISPASVALESLGDTARLTASVRDRDGRTMPGVTVTWVAGDATVATVDASGLVTATGNGVATVEASVEGVAGSSEVTVAQRVANARVSPEEWTFRALGDTMIGNLPSLSAIVVSDNRLSGRIPSALGNLEFLAQLEVANNELTGPIPSRLGSLQRLVELDVSGNRLNGPVPPEIGNLDRLKVLRVNDTLLSGQLPLELIGLSLRVFTWDGMDLCAPDDEEFQEWLKSIPSTSGPDC